MHLKEYAIDTLILFTALSAKLYSQFTGLTLEVGNLHIDKLVYVLVMLLTGFTTLYRFVKEVRADRKAKAEEREKQINKLKQKNKENEN